MNWIRDNIVKVLIILGVAVAVIIICALMFKPKGDTTVSGTKYGEIENKLQAAAIKYIGQHKKLLPTTTETTTKVELRTLQSNNFIGNIVAIEDSSIKCNGYVEIVKLSEDKEEYRYTPYISCGEFYVTKTIGDYIIDLETKDGSFERLTDDGLYKMGDEYIFRGENLNNYIQIDTHLYRVIKIASNKSLQLISINKTTNTYAWDDRYNIEKNTNEGINNFIKSRLHDSLVKLYNPTGERDEIYFTEKEKTYIIPHEYCIGRRSSTDTNIYSGVECKETTTLNVGIISLNEYSRASIDSNCKSIFDKSCGNYNFFNSLKENSNNNNYTFLTLTGTLDNTYQFYRVRNGEVSLSKTYNSAQLYPVVYINEKTIYSSGTGTAADPYIVR